MSNQRSADKTHLSVWVSKGLKKKLDVRAAVEKTSLSDVVTKILTAEIERESSSQYRFHQESYMIAADALSSEHSSGKSQAHPGVPAEPPANEEVPPSSRSGATSGKTGKRRKRSAHG